MSSKHTIHSHQHHNGWDHSIPPVLTGARDAVRAMIDRLGREVGLDPVDAYLLCSVCADLRISEIVDQPNRVVSLYFPRVVFD